MAPAASTRWSNGRSGWPSTATVRAVPVDAGDAALPEPHVGLAVEQAPHDVGHVGGAQPGGGHLVQERLEGVEVVLVDEGDLDRRALQAPGDLEPAEPGADHHDLGDHRHGRSLPDAL